MAEPTFTLQFPYRRSLGPVVGAFFTGLRDGKVLAARTREGRVLCPPLEYDPETGQAVETELVEVAAQGIVEHWAWCPEPSEKQPLDKPFAWALVKLDGADSAILHALDAPHDQIASGMRVRIRWREEREGKITDIACFEPVS